MSVLWLILSVKGLRHPAPHGVWTAALAQISALAALAGVLRTGHLAGALTGLFPPVLLISMWQIPSLAITAKILPYTLAAARAALALCLSLRRLRRFTILLTGLTAIAVTLPVGQRISQTHMCETAAALGLQNFTARSFAWSVAHAGDARTHALARDTAGLLIWSNSDLSWHQVTWGTNPGRPPSALDCPA